jgi:allantoinase
MSTYDLLLRGGTLVTINGSRQGDIAVADGRIVALDTEISGTAHEEIDAHGLHVMAGVIDSHVHFNEPGRNDWEGMATGSQALAAGGATMFCDMPLNSTPPTVNAENFERKVAAARAASCVDFALWGGLIPGNREQLAELADKGVIGFKAFMSNSGIDDFPAVDDLTLYEGMAQAAQLGKIVAVHAEDERITSALAQRALTQGRTGARDFVASRPIIAELAAIERAILFAAETGCALHIVHVSSGRGVSMVAQARACDIDVSCETCPHYLVLTEEDLETLGGIAKCAPPLRSHTEQNELWRHVQAGNVDFIASDHSPAPLSMKCTANNFFQIWGGISGCQSLLSLLITEGYAQHNIPLHEISALTSFNVAQRYQLPPHKGQLAVNADADLVLIDLQQRHILQAEDLFYRHPHSPYIGMPLRGQIVRTFVRGITVFHNGQASQQPIGQLITPIPSAVKKAETKL